jgi:hypothetical protein
MIAYKIDIKTGVLGWHIKHAKEGYRATICYRETKPVYGTALKFCGLHCPLFCVTHKHPDDPDMVGVELFCSVLPDRRTFWARLE